jgi:hypothetical protein
MPEPFCSKRGAKGTIGAAITNSGTFDQLSSTLSFTGNLSNSGYWEVDNTNGGGGSNLSVGGTLINTGAVQLGPTNFTLADTLTATIGGLVNGTDGSLAVQGSASQGGKLTVNGRASNAGILNIDNYSTLSATGGNDFTQTAGTTTVRGTVTAASIDIDGGTFAVDTNTFTNNTTLWASTGGLIDFTNGALTNLSTGTLTGGVYEVDANSILRFASAATISADDADIILKGTNALIESGTTLFGAELTSIGTTGALHLFSGASFNSTTGFVDSGLIDLNAGTFTASGIGVGSGTIHGNGTVAAIIENQGTVDASGGRLDITKSVSGTGLFTIEAASALEFDSTVAAGVSITFGGIGSTLTMGTIAQTAFAGTLVNFAPGETIDLLDAVATSAAPAGSAIIVNLKGGWYPQLCHRRSAGEPGAGRRQRRVQRHGYRCVRHRRAGS